MRRSQPLGNNGNFLDAYHSVFLLSRVCCADSTPALSELRGACIRAPRGNSLDALDSCGVHGRAGVSNDKGIVTIEAVVIGGTHPQRSAPTVPR